jgi:putative transposase
VSKKYQTNVFDTSALAVPEQVSIAMEEIAADMREGLLALAVGAGLQVMQQLMESDVTAVCGPRGKHDSDRTATRHGIERGSVTLGGRRVPVTRPRVRAADGSGEVAVPAYQLFTSTELLGRMAMERMLAGVSTRRYPVALEPVGEGVEEEARSISKSAVSRKFVAMTSTRATLRGSSEVVRGARAPRRRTRVTEPRQPPISCQGDDNSGVAGLSLPRRFSR